MLDMGEAPELTTRQAITLYRVGTLVSASLDLDTTLQAVVEAAHQLMGADATALSLLDAESNLAMRVALGVVSASIGEQIPLDGSITGRAFIERRPILVPDMLEEPSRARPDLDERYAVRCFLAVPLVCNLECVGVITLSFNAPAALSESDLPVVGALAQQAATAVAHAREYAEEQRLRAESQRIMQQCIEQAQQLERARRQLVQNEKLTAIGQLIQGLAHEMNTPLSVVIANLSVLERYTESLAAIARAAQLVVPHVSADPVGRALVTPLADALKTADLEYVLEDAPSLLDESGAASRRAADLVKSLSTFARRETNGPQPVVIQEVLEASLNLASNALKHRAQIQRHYADVPQVSGLASELSQVFVHVLINAAQSLAGTRGSIRISTQHSGEWVIIKVADNGCGIAPEHLDRIFEPFFTTRAPGDGTGMGLAVAYGIIQRHGGAIAVDSQVQHGTTVTIRLPIAQSLREAA